MRCLQNIFLLFFSLTLIFTFEAHATIPWHVTDTWIEVTKTFPPKEKILASSSSSETSKTQFIDDEGNTVERTTTNTYQISGKVIEYWIQKRQFWRLEKINKKGELKVKTHGGRTYRELLKTENDSTKKLINTSTSEKIIAYAPKPEKEEVTQPQSDSPDKATTFDFGVNTSYLGTPTSMPSNQSSYYLGLSEFKANLNGAVNQDAALARGWTGKGSTIGILDTGIDMDHAEFDNQNKIIYTKDYTATGMQDNIGHGTHVASIAAAELDGNGMTGIAPDANLAIFKISNNWNLSTNAARKAIKLAKDEGLNVTVYNLSANTNYSSDYRDAMTYQGNGIYTNNHAIYGGANYYNLEKPNGWANALSGSESVLVVSAGNSSIGYVQSPAVFATTTNDDGSLMLDGRMIIAGNWNLSTQTLDSAGAGHVCKNWDGNQCSDKYKTSEFYLMAPGMSVYGADYDGGYRTYSGSSQSAPVISGAVAVIHQMWPYMKGRDIVKVLLATGNKDLPNYDINLHGQGLLDLDAATKPYGDIGISYTGRTGTTVPISGGISVAGGGELANAALSSISVVDQLDREYKVDLSSFSQTVDLIPIYQLDHTAGNAWSSKFVGGTMEYQGIHFNTYETPATLDKNAFTNISLGLDSSAFSKRNPETGDVLNKDSLSHRLTFSQSQFSPFVAFNGMFGEVNSTSTFEYSALYQPNHLYGQLGLMYSLTDINEGLVKDVTPITSFYAVAGWADKNINMYAGIKPMVIDGSIELNLPTSVNYEGTMHYQKHKFNLNSDPVTFIGAQFKSDSLLDRFENSHSMKLNALADQNAEYKLGLFYEMFY